MKVTYLNHSGFLLEWENCYWLFDYYKGPLPPLESQKNILVFCSHSHEDHFNPTVFELANLYPSTHFIFSKELQAKCTAYRHNILFLEDWTDTQLTLSSGEILQIHTLKSTDCGCAFLINYCDKTIYHAGDLHWWYWEGEDPAWNDAMTTDYKNEMEYLAGKSIDLAFTPLDPRQGKDYALGMNYFLSITETKHLFPMHFWDDFMIIRHYAREYPISAKTNFYFLQRDGQSFELML